LLADVYSYAEDDMVIDPLLADHLAHFGIDIMSMKKVRMMSLMLLKKHPQKCHFLYFLEWPLQQFCTAVQTVMPNMLHSVLD